MASRWRAILPQKFKVAAFKAALAVGGKDVGEEILKDFKATTRTWDHQPRFVVKSSGIFSMNVSVTTDDQIYGWVNDGTKPRVIKGVGPVSIGFIPKTKPGVIGSEVGSKGVIHFAKNIQHPGSEARKFDEAIKDKWNDKLGDKFQTQLDLAAIASGHSIGIRGRI